MFPFAHLCLGLFSCFRGVYLRLLYRLLVLLSDTVSVFFFFSTCGTILWYVVPFFANMYGVTHLLLLRLVALVCCLRLR